MTARQNPKPPIPVLRQIQGINLPAPPNLRNCWGRWSLSLNGSTAAGNGRDCRIPVDIRQTRTLPEVWTTEDALSRLRVAVLELRSCPPSAPSGVIRLEVPIQRQVDAISWLHSQFVLPRCYFSSRSPRDTINGRSVINGDDGGTTSGEKNVISVAGVGSSVYFQQPSPFSLEDWWCIRRFLYKECPLIRAYGSMRFDPWANVSPEWKSFGSFYFTIPQVEMNGLQGSSLLATTIAWDETLHWTWENAVDSSQATLSQIAFSISEFCKEEPIIVLGVDHIPDKACWEMAVKNALKAINSTNFDSVLRKVVLARSSRIHANAVIDPLCLLASLQREGRHFYQFCIQPLDSPAFVGNTPEQLFHRVHLNVSSEAVAGTRPRGRFLQEDLHIHHEFLCSAKDHLEFEIVRETIKRKLELICKQVMVDPEKTILKLPRVQHLCARIQGKLISEDDEFDILSSLHPTPAVCGFPTNEARQFIERTEMFDRGMYAGPVGWFGGNETEFAVGIRSGLVDMDRGALIYAGAGIVNGTIPSVEWDELELKASQLLKFLCVNNLSTSCQTIDAGI